MMATVDLPPDYLVGRIPPDRANAANPRGQTAAERGLRVRNGEYFGQECAGIVVRPVAQGPRLPEGNKAPIITNLYRAIQVTSLLTLLQPAHHSLMERLALPNT